MGHILGNIGGFLAVAAVYGSVIGVLLLLAAKVRRSGVGGGVMGPFEEMWHPEGAQFRMVIEQYEERGVTVPSPDNDDDDDDDSANEDAFGASGRT
jgi:hypothetical protein